MAFNPTYGFELKNATFLKNNGVYVCKTVSEDGRPQELIHTYKIHSRYIALFSNYINNSGYQNNLNFSPNVIFFFFSLFLNREDKNK